MHAYALIAWFSFLAAMAAQPGSASAAAEAAPAKTVSTDPNSIEQLYSVRCQGCHEPAVSGAPSIEEMRRRIPERVLKALTTGVMAPFAQTLTLEQRVQVAEYLTGKKVQTDAIEQLEKSLPK